MSNDIELHGVHKNYGDLAVVKDVSIAVPKGKFVSILGPSGCGKSTTLNMIAGFQEPNAGRIEFRGVNQVGVPPEHRDIGLVFQNYALFPHMTVFENVGFGLKMMRKSQEEIASATQRALRSVHLEGFDDRYPKELSGGQQQRVALARAIAPQPSVLLLDEPLSNLDLKLREKMRIELKEIQQQLGMTFVYVTHDQEEAMAMSDHIVVMSDGKVAQQGEPDDIYQFPSTSFVADFIGKSNILPVSSAEKNGQELTLTVQGTDLKIISNNATTDASGNVVSCCIRPERILLFDESVHLDSDRNVLVGEVCKRVNLGGHSEVWFKIAPELVLSVQLRTTLAQALKMNQPAKITFRYHAVWPLQT